MKLKERGVFGSTLKIGSEIGLAIDLNYHMYARVIDIKNVNGIFWIITDRYSVRADSKAIYLRQPWYDGRYTVQDYIIWGYYGADMIP